MTVSLRMCTYLERARVFCPMRRACPKHCAERCVHSAIPEKSADPFGRACRASIACDARTQAKKYNIIINTNNTNNKDNHGITCPASVSLNFPHDRWCGITRAYVRSPLPSHKREHTEVTLLHALVGSLCVQPTRFHNKFCTNHAYVLRRSQGYTMRVALPNPKGSLGF